MSSYSVFSYVQDWVQMSFHKYKYSLLSVLYSKCLSVPGCLYWPTVSAANTPSLLGRRKPSKDAGRRPAIQRVILEFLEFHGLFPIPFSFSYIRGTPHSFINQNVYYFGKQHELTEFWIGIQSTMYVLFSIAFSWCFFL